MTMKQTRSGNVTKERLFDEFNTVIAETEQLLKSLASAGNGKVDDLKAGVGQRLADAGDRLAKIREEALSQASAVARDTDEYVQANPWRSIGIVAAASALAGLVAGLLISRR
jgi:ElaB/YqjD/DUF883 family membrane-anchored ribosome-binding protein